MLNSYPLDNHSSVLKAVDEFVFLNNNLGILPNHFVSTLTELIPAFKAYEQGDVVYSTYVRTFRSLVEYIDNSRKTLEYEMYFKGLGKSEIYRLSSQLKCCQSDFAKELKRYKENKQSNSESFAKYIKTIIYDYSCVLIVRVDLSYREEYLPEVTFDQFLSDVERLRSYLKDRHGDVQHLLGYGMALEQGQSKGFHIHLYLIYNAARVQQDGYFAMSMIKHWKEITTEMGTGYNVNNKEKKEEYRVRGLLGVGKIHRNCQHEVDNALMVASYLNRAEKWYQRLLIRFPKMQTFSKGEYTPHGRNYQTRYKDKLKEVVPSPALVGVMTRLDVDTLDELES